MEKDRDQLTPDEPEDWAKLQRSRGQGTGGTGYDRLPGEEAPANLHEGKIDDVLSDPIPDTER
jgi:hypothetical protein